MVFSFVILSTQNIVNHFNLSGESEMFLNSIEKKSRLYRLTFTPKTVHFRIW